MSAQNYFLGSSSADGFLTPIHEILNNESTTAYLLKGTAGSGKSTLMKKISEAFGDSPQEIYHCSSDPYSLDGVYLKDKKVLIMDSTAPHCFDPKYPLAVQTIIDLGAYINSTQLKARRSEIVAVTDKYGEYHRSCRYYLSAVTAVIDDIRSAAASILDTDKLDKSAERLVKKLAPKKCEKSHSGKISQKQLSAITMNGYSSYPVSCTHIYQLTDVNLAAAAYMLNTLSDKLTKKGYNVIASRCCLSSEHYTEHIIIPELDTAIVTASFLGDMQNEKPDKIISCKRFYRQTENSSQLKSRIKFGQKAAKVLIDEAAAVLKQAKSVHDDIEQYYIGAADFDGINRLIYKLISEIRSLPQA